MIFAGVLLLLAGLIPLSQPYRHSLAWQVPDAYDEAVQKALLRGADAFGMSPDEYRRSTRPRIEQRGDETCIRLVSHRSDGGGSYLMCHDRHGAIVSERVSFHSLGAETIWDRFGRWMW